ncbi:MAG: DUF1320 domain-containing protein [Puniceicoccales bacterium]|jgi:phage gp36-like protein|nr:DUF1320 domain-containing protein [Puniceicoccales bacterium]
MAWISLTVERVASRLTGPEMDAVESAAKDPRQPDPLKEVVEFTVNEIRGRVKACRKNKLGPAGTIPDQLVGTALAIIRFRLLSRLPVPALNTPAREKEYDDAIKLLADVASCKFALEVPDELGPEQMPGGGSPHVRSRPRIFSRKKQSGI